MIDDSTISKVINRYKIVYYLCGGKFEYLQNGMPRYDDINAYNTAYDSWRAFLARINCNINDRMTVPYRDMVLSYDLFGTVKFSD